MGMADNDTPASTLSAETGGKDPDPAMEFNTLRQLDVHRVVKENNISKSSGLSNIISFIIKEAFSILNPVITHMMNMSINTATFLEEVIVIPIPKAGSSALVKNYRPISLLPLPGKILEKLVHTQLSSHIESNMSYCLTTSMVFARGSPRFTL